MKVGLRKSTRMDLSVKHIFFEVDGKRHHISFRFSHRKGITDPIIFDSQKAKLLDAYPPLPELLRFLVALTWLEFKMILRKFLHNMQDRNQ